MLEIKNLTKIYKSKGGVEVRALDNISTKFQETGMIFLLGKSGSGKSTLLNVCGGLDTPTSGEILVKGKSSLNFKQSDFDSYRNTFIGFIFQEYNILDEFTVEENIALALELQGREKDLNKINQLLEKVELKGYNDRKPNTLSGGQKQRLAIARALVKSPEIIMADEPTGALDSETGKQVFDTLKELSKDTLVLVVSHDRDFALKYADRIIELKDGKIISDLSKTNTNEFIDTKESDIELKKYDPKETEFISSKFPFKHAIRIGLSSFKMKKVRLVMTIFLCTIAFIMFGLLSTLMFYNQEATFKDTLKNSNIPYLQITKEYDVKQTTYFNDKETYTSNNINFGHFTKEEVDNYINKYGSDTFGAITVDTSLNVQDSTIPYWVNSIYTYAYLKPSNKNRINMLGKYPENDNQIAISSYSANVIINSKIDDYDTGKTLNVNTQEDLIGKKIKLQNVVYTITGIIDSGSINPIYDSLKQVGKVDDDFYANFMKELQDGLHLIAFVSENRLSILSVENSYVFDNFTNRMISLAVYHDGKYNFDNASIGYYASYDQVFNNYDYLNLTNYTKLNDSEALVSYDYLAEVIINMEMLDENLYKLAYSLFTGFEEIEIDNQLTSRKLSYEEIKTMANQLYNLVKNKNMKFEFGIKSCDPKEGSAVGQTYEFSIAGIFIPNGSSDNLIIVSDNIYQKLLNYEINNFDNINLYATNYIDKGYYDIIYVSYDKSNEATDMFYNIRANKEFDEYDSREGLTGSIIFNLDSVDDFVTDFSLVFFYVGLVLAVFAILLFSNFISVSISTKKREIGILRAIGAKGMDVFKIFLSESSILSIICIIFSSLGTIIISMVFNNILNLEISVFVFGLKSFLIIVLIAILTAFIATFLPVNNIAKKKPIDSIRTIN